MAIGTIGALIGGSLLSAGVGLFGAKKAADATTAAANTATGLQRYIYNQNRKDMAPWLQAGNKALAAYNYEMGLSPKPTQYSPGSLKITTDAGTPAATAPAPGTPPGQWSYDDASAPAAAPLTAPGGTYHVGDHTFDSLAAAKSFVQAERAKRDNSFDYTGFKESPGYAFQLSEGLKGLDRYNAAHGTFYSGAALKDATRFQGGLLSQEYGTYMNRLAAAAGLGQSTATQLAGLGTNYANNAGSLMLNAGQARATGYENMASQFNQGAGNIMNLYSLYKLGGLPS